MRFAQMACARFVDGRALALAAIRHGSLSAIVPGGSAQPITRRLPRTTTCRSIAVRTAARYSPSRRRSHEVPLHILASPSALNYGRAARAERSEAAGHLLCSNDVLLLVSRFLGLSARRSAADSARTQEAESSSAVPLACAETGRAAVVSETQPFEFHMERIGSRFSCSMCAVYEGEVAVHTLRVKRPLGFCRVCLRRMRATLKAAEKALPPLPKRTRPSEE